MNISIDSLADADLESADTILQLAFQSSVSRIDDLRIYRKLSPDGWFLASHRGQPVGMVGAVNYGTFAQVGYLAVHPGEQRKGIGLALMEFLLARLDQQNIPRVFLDASEAGRPLYEKLGFTVFGETLTFQRHRNTAIRDRPSNIQVITVRELDELAQWDSTAFGMNRKRVLQILLAYYPERAFMLRDGTGKVAGYFLAQERRIGPWVTHRSEDAEILLQVALSLPYKEPVSIVIPAENEDGMKLLRHYGFKQVRTNHHMGTGQGESPGQRKKIYAQTNLAIG
jgi:predicted N-acetyltransferase YhbS